MTAVAVTVVSGWLQQGGTSLVSAIFADDNALRPKIHVAPREYDATCTTWLLRQDATSVAGELKKALRNTSASSNADGHRREEIFDRVRRATGSDLPTGSLVEVTIQNPSDKAIVLTRLEISVKKRTEPVPNSLMHVGTGCGEGLQERLFSIDLDAGNPKLSPQIDASGKRTPDFPYKVSSDDPEVFKLNGYSEKMVEWTATLHWVADGKEGKTEIDNGGRPFLSYSDTASRFWFDAYYDTLRP
ncbi:hypothetical protein [Streptomyces kanasensis]|uniref:hypothetical protein n=1 Tax=Streptomyces kanasensis TaxID=936756 RepID=UPI0037F7C690